MMNITSKIRRGVGIPLAVLTLAALQGALRLFPVFDFLDEDDFAGLQAVAQIADVLVEQGIEKGDGARGGQFADEMGLVAVQGEAVGFFGHENDGQQPNERARDLPNTPRKPACRHRYAFPVSPHLSPDP